MKYFALVGEQPMPVLIPLWQNIETCTGIHLIASERTKKIAEDLCKVIKNDPQLKNIPVLQHSIIDPYNLAEATKSLRNLILPKPDSEVFLFNLTGGTKIMSLAALQASHNTDTQLLYVSTEIRKILFFTADNPSVEEIPIRINISVQQYFSAHGLESSHNQNFTDQPVEAPPTKEGDRLERHVYDSALQSREFDDVQRNIFIRKSVNGKTVPNELDVVVIKNGSLAVCSCKSGKNVDENALYQLESLSRRESFGIYCGKLLVMTSNEPKPGLVSRAKADNIQLVSGDQVCNIVQFILNSIK